ncbi:MAG: RNA polymerase subunit sigma-70, partial [Bacteroidota bacterium]
MPIQPSLIKACRKGDRRAQLTLYKECYGMLMGVCYRYKNNQYDATAMMNKGFTKIVQNLKRYKP